MGKDGKREDESRRGRKESARVEWDGREGDE